MRRLTPLIFVMVAAIGSLRSNSGAFAASAMSFEDAVAALSANEKSQLSEQHKLTKLQVERAI